MTPTQTITVSAEINAAIEKVWNFWISPEHITNWNHASDEWHCPLASNDVKVGGELNWRMEAKDGSFGFDFKGTYTMVILNKVLEYVLDDGRKVAVSFSTNGENTAVEESFEAETSNTIELQQQGWQAILNNFKQYVESK